MSVRKSHLRFHRNTQKVSDEIRYELKKNNHKIKNKLSNIFQTELSDEIEGPDTVG
jgi:hypothetical protein